MSVKPHAANIRTSVSADDAPVLADTIRGAYSSTMSFARMMLPIAALLTIAGCESKDKAEQSETATSDKGAATAPDEKPTSPPVTGKQTFAEAIQVMCDAPLAEGIATAEPAERMKRIAMHIEENVTHKRARFAFQALAEIAPQQRYERMKGFTNEANISSCRLIEDYAAQSQVPAVAGAAPTADDDTAEAKDEAMGTAASAGEEADKAMPLESHYVGKHKLGVNRVNHGKRNGKGEIVREANALVLQASVKKGEYYLDISGIVNPVSKTEFVLDGQFSGVPDLSWRQVAPAKQSTTGKFTFRATRGRRFWRLYEVDGVECVCDDNCGNDFCYIDLSF